MRKIRIRGSRSGSGKIPVGNDKSFQKVLATVREERAQRERVRLIRYSTPESGSASSQESSA